MFTAEQYRAKAAEYGGLVNAARSVVEAAQYRDLKQSYSSLADNLDWLATNPGKTVSANAGDPARRARADQRAADAEQENILRCLGAAVILTWNTIPTTLQRELFEAASGVQDNARTAPLKDVLAQFLHDHKDDAQKQPNDA